MYKQIVRRKPQSELFIWPTMTELVIGLMVTLSGIAAFLSNRSRKRILQAGILFFASALFFWALFVCLYRFRATNFTNYSVAFVWLILGALCVSVSLFLGYLLHLAGINGWLSWRVTIFSCILAGVMTGLSLIKVQYVERQTFDSQAPQVDSDYIVAHGWPVAFVGDVSGANNYGWLPGDTVLLTPMLTDWLVSLYASFVLSLSIKRYALAR